MILIALGANIPSRDGTLPRAACRGATWALAALPGVTLEAVSGWFETEPMPASGQPVYINGVARLRGEADPAELLARLHLLEAAAGRGRAEQNAARPLDLDIIAMGAEGGLIRDAPDPILPHPRTHLRAFVLAPLADVAPGWMHPRLGKTAEAMLAALPSQGCRRL